MSGVSISSMTAAAAALRTMEMEVNDAGTTRKVTIDQILSLSPIAGPCRVATTANLASLSGLLTVDGVTVAAGDRVLVKDQTTASANGIYTAASGSWTRATDADAWAELPGMQVAVLQGTVNADRIYLCTSNPGGTLGTTAVTFARVDAGGASSITVGTAVASTSGTSIDFTGIPSTAKRVTVAFDGVSTSGTSLIQFQLGDSGGIETTGYTAVGGLIYGTTPNTANSTSGFPINANLATHVTSGAITFTLMGSNTWVAQGVFAGTVNANQSMPVAGVKQVSAVLDRVRITTVGGTDTFDGGTINIAWES